MVTTVRRGVTPARLFLFRGLRSTRQVIRNGIQMNRTSRTPTTIPIIPPVVTAKREKKKKVQWSFAICFRAHWNKQNKRQRQMVLNAGLTQ